MSVQSEINRISGNVTAALAAIAEKGVSVPSGSKSDALAQLIASIEAGLGGDDTKIAYGTFVPSSNEYALEVEHNLGAIPNYAFFCADDISRNNNSRYAGYFNPDGMSMVIQSTSTSSGMQNGYRSDLDITNANPTSTASTCYYIAAYGATAKTIKFGNENQSVRFFKSGVTYHWMVGVA